MNMDAVRCKRVGLCDAVLSVTHPLLSSLLQSHPRCTRTAAAVTQSAAHGVCQQQEPRPYRPALTEKGTKEPSSVWVSKSYRGPLLNKLVGDVDKIKLQ